MTRIIKFLMWGAGALLIIFVLAVAGFAFLFDPNALRDDITRIVEKQTGRQLAIEGDLSLSYFPWLGFEAGSTTLSNAPGFDEPVMASFESASASVKLLPLLQRRVELSKVTLDGVDLKLAVNAEGVSNWDDLAALQGEDTGDDPDSDGTGFSTQGVGGIELNEARISYADATTGDSYLIKDLELQTGPLVPGTAFELAARGDIEAGSLEIAGPVSLSGQVQIDDDGTLRITTPVMTLAATGAGVPGDQLAVTLEAPALVLGETTLELEAPVLAMTGTGGGDPWSRMEGTLGAASLTLEDFERFDAPTVTFKGTIESPDLPVEQLEAAMSGQQLQGSLEHGAAAIDVVQAQLLGLSLSSRKVKVSNIYEDIVIEAPIDVKQFVPIDLLRKLGFTDVVTADPDALKSSSFTANARYGPDSMGVKNLKGMVDGTAVSGSVRMMTSGEVRFDITADAVNLDRYRAPAEEADADGGAVAIADIEIPAEALRELALEGTLNIGSMELVGLKTADVTLGIRAAGGDVRVKPARAALYGGSYVGDIRLDARNAVPVLSLNESLENVQFGPFAKDLLGDTKLSGKVDGRITVSAQGRTSHELTSSANGDAVFKFTDGAYEGTDIWHRVRSARAVIKGTPAPAEAAGDRTRFADLSGSATISNGVLTSKDLSMVLPFMKVRGEGSMVLLTQEVDFRLKGDIVDRPELDADVNDLVGVTVPIKMTGTISEPSIGVDMKAVLAELAKKKLLDRIGLGGKSAADAGGEAGAEAEEPKDVKEELEDKLKDKLKGIFGGG
ncbi:MAG: AsmA family protein [Gammaproteobacteria bacterium]|nr:AsmA family protein [Gammaproteobacteria bacterium]